jgi:hypothetical protein
MSTEIESTSNPAPMQREGRVAPSIDIDEKKDRALIRTAASRRWPVPPDLKTRVVEALARALSAATELSEVVDVSRTLVVIEGQNQVDDHLADKNKRMDEGKPTERVAVEPVVLERPINPNLK